jgi:TRAP-type C4-dicarboxylate transport system permease small subunit
VYFRQRDAAFPDSEDTEAQFWRNLFKGKRALSRVQIAGILILVVAVLGLVVGITIEDNGGSFWQNVLGALIRWVLAFGILGAFLMVFSITRELHHRRTMKLKDKTDRTVRPTPTDPKFINTART